MPESMLKVLDLLGRLQLLTPPQLDETRTAAEKSVTDLKGLVGDLVKRGWLTRFQVEQINQDRGKGLVLGPYRLVEPLGFGGMGQVYKARHVHMQRLVALKVIGKDRLSSPGAALRFQREVQALARITPHPNVVIAHDAQLEGDVCYLVMEYLEGTNLAQLIKQRGPLPVGEACEYARQAALGLQHAHTHGLIHRDVKPANLMLTSGGSGGGHTVSEEAATPVSAVVKLLDLGLARLREGSGEGAGTADGHILGTPDYIAPEQAEAAGKVDIRADIYSLGCTLYHLLAGQPPFASGSALQKISGHLHSTPPPLESLRPDLRPELIAVIRRMMARPPDQRYRTPAEVAVALTPFCPNAAPVARIIEGQTAITSSVIAIESGSGAATTASGVLADALNQPARRRYSRAVAVIFALVALVAFLVLRPGSGGGVGDEASTTITVRLEGIAQVHDPGVVFVLNGKERTGKELQEPIELEPGEHELIIRRGEQILDRRKFVVGPGDRNGRSIDLAEPEDDIRTGLIATFKKTNSSSDVLAVAFQDGGRRFVSCHDEGSQGQGAKVRVWDIDTATSTTAVEVPSRVSTAVLSVDGQLAALVTGYPEQEIGVYEVSTGKRLCLIKTPGDVRRGATIYKGDLSFSPDGSCLYSAFSYRGYGKVEWFGWIWDARAGTELRRIDGGGGRFSPDGRRILVSTPGAAVLRDTKQPNVPQKFTTPKIEWHDLAFSPNGRHIAILEKDPKTKNAPIRVIDLATNQTAQTLVMKSFLVSFEFSPDAKRLFWGDENELHIVDVESGKDLWSQENPKLRSHLRAVAFSPSGRRLLTGHLDGIRLWSLPR